MQRPTMQFVRIKTPVSVFKCFETLSGFSRTEALARLLFQIRRLCAGTAIVVV